MPKFAAKSLIKFPNAFYFVSIFLILLLVAVYLIYEFHRQLTVSAKQQYIGLVSANLISADQSMDELMNTLDIGKSSYEKVLGNTQTNGDLNYSIIVGNNQKSLSQIGLLKDNLDFQKKLLSSAKTPREYQTLEDSFNNYYVQSNEFLEELGKNYEYESSLLQNVTAATIGINISQKTLWEEADKDLILSHFKTLKSDTNSSIEKLSQINTPDRYQEYYNLYLSYFKLIASAAEQITAILEEDLVSLDSDSPNSIEIAYKTSIDSQNEINKLTQKITEERERIFALEENTEEIEALAAVQQDIENKIKGYYQLLYSESNTATDFGF